MQAEPTPQTAATPSSNTTTTTATSSSSSSSTASNSTGSTSVVRHPHKVDGVALAGGRPPGEGKEERLVVAASVLTGDRWNGSLALAFWKDLERNKAATTSTWSGTPDAAWMEDEGGNTCILAASDDGSVLVLSEKLANMSALNEHDDTVVSLSVHGSRCLSGSWDASIKLWKPSETTSSIDTFTGHSDMVHSVSWNANGNSFVSGSQDHTVRLWGLGTDKPTATVACPSRVHAVACHPADEAIFAAGMEDGLVQLYDSRNLSKPLNSVALHTSIINRLQFSSHNAALLASASDDCAVIVFNTAENRPCYRYAHHDFARALAWSRHRPGLLISGSWDCTLVAHRLLA